MSTITLNYWGYPVEVDYDYTEGDKGDYFTPPTEEWVEIHDWRFESEEALEELNLYNENACRSFEDEITQGIVEHERAKKAREAWIKPYLRAKGRRINKFNH